MKIHRHKSQEHESQSVGNTISQKRSIGNTFHFTDNRPEAIAQRKLRDIANNFAVQQLPPIQKQIKNTTEAPIQFAISKSGIRNEDDHVTGAMNYSFQWNASPTEDKGYIIQFIDRTETTFLGNESRITNVQYWEAWRVDNGVIFNGLQDLSNAQHDSWANGDMPPGSHGEIVMNAHVFHSDNMPTNMGFGNVLMAGGLLSGKSKPDVLMTTKFFHMHTFKWDRRLQSDNINQVIAREMRIALELGGEDGQSFIEMSEEWGDEEWDSFAEDVNSHDTANKIDSAEIKKRALEI